VNENGNRFEEHNRNANGNYFRTKITVGLTLLFIHSFVRLFICTVIKATYTAKMCIQDNKAAYATLTLTVALYNWTIKHYYTPRTRCNQQFQQTS